MKLKNSLLSVLGRDTLRAIADGLAVDGVDRRSVRDMTAALSRSRLATAEAILEYMSEAEVKAACEEFGIPPIGRRAVLIQSLLKAEGNSNNKRKSAEETRSMDDSRTSVPEPAPTRLPAAPPGMIRVTRTELVWPGKYEEDGTRKEVPRVSLPFQVIETINESRATREAKKDRQPTLFDVWEADEGDSFEDGWKNKLIWGDNLIIMGSLLARLAGKIDLIYIDPPFATGADFTVSTQVGDNAVEITKEQSLIEEKAYRDTWGRGIDSYLHMLANRVRLIHDLLAPTGVLFLHIGQNLSHLGRSICDDIFGVDRFINQFIWKRTFAHGDFGQGADHCGRLHDVILLYSKSDSYTWNDLFTDYDQEYLDSFYKHVEPKSGRRYALASTTAPGGAGKGNPQYEFLGITRFWRFSKERMEQMYRDELVVQSKPGAVPRRKLYLDEAKGVPLQDLWTDIAPVQGVATEATGFPTQKPERLLSRVIELCSKPGQLVADLFCGSGTTLGVAEKLGRRWIGCDIGRFAIHTTRKRLLGIKGSKPFEILNLGRYERQYWQGVTFGEQRDKPLTERALFEYLAFVLRLYGAQPVAGVANLHGKKGRAMIHIGAVDAPVTIDEINMSLAECVQLKQNELHVLGWEWEMGLYDLMVAEAKRQGVKLLLLQIPREVMEQQAVDKGDIQFFELAYLEVEIKTTKKLTAVAKLKDFVIPNTELIPEDVRTKVKKWSDYIDYWAVDWDFQHDTFMQGWVTYRTRQDRIISLESDPHTYEKRGRYRVLVKVIDIFGNDTSQAFDVEIC